MICENQKVNQKLPATNEIFKGQEFKKIKEVQASYTFLKKIRFSLKFIWGFQVKFSRFF